ncbi:gluconokinase [Streptacidiphilus sp. MAP5-3]|uniref:gluconokinase n=1 Tax=unclassified Streptacidiphilus TaxID=2643834 RepID=UPI003513805D
MVTNCAKAPHRPIVIVVLGVSGVGKSTVGVMLAERLGLPFKDADDFHSPENRARMTSGRPLTDEDRRPWLAAIARWIDEQLESGESAVLACSALKRSHRDFLRQGRPEVRLMYLEGSQELVAARLAARQGHFFPARLLESQFGELEEPTPDEHPCVVPLADSPEQTVARALQLLAEPPSPGG